MKHHEDWQELCRQAAVEQDPDRLLELTRRINQILLEKEERLRKGPDGQGSLQPDKESN